MGCLTYPLCYVEGVGRLRRLRSGSVGLSLAPDGLNPPLPIWVTDLTEVTDQERDYGND